MTDEIALRGSALLSGTRRRLVKAGAAVAWTVPVMHTLTAEHAFARISPGRFDVQLTHTRGEPCDTRTPIAQFCYKCNPQGNVVFYDPGSYFVQAYICNDATPCQVTATLTAPFGSTFAAPFEWQNDQAVHVCRNRGTASQSSTSLPSSSAVTLNLAANECVVIEWHLDTGSNIPCPSSMPASQTYTFTVTLIGTCGGFTDQDSVTAYLKGSHDC